MMQITSCLSKVMDLLLHSFFFVLKVLKGKGGAMPAVFG